MRRNFLLLRGLLLALSLRTTLPAAAMEVGLRSLMADGEIPKVALEIYEKRSRERVARAEARTAIADFINDAEGGPF
ncbi:hypothetical protein [Synechococcus sp. CC9605]|uniref:hypothetical protein n=1 Tax=Synechococcus sp. (strain CC9605) TaxID=110662 RepID=UPI00059B6FBE|nr:hypothetical protein [Synechococcus sp. CC9605]